MSKADIQKMWFDAYRRLSEEADQLRDSQSVSFGLLEVYDGLADPEKEGVHSILAEWLRSDDNKRRYDAKFIISQRKVRSMKAAIEKAIAKFANQPGPEASDYTKDLRRIVGQLN